MSGSLFWSPTPPQKKSKKVKFFYKRDNMQLFSADATIFKKIYINFLLSTKRWKNHPQKLFGIKYPIFFHPELPKRPFMLKNVAYRPTVYKTGMCKDNLNQGKRMWRCNLIKGVMGVVWNSNSHKLDVPWFGQISLTEGVTPSYKITISCIKTTEFPLSH